MTIGTVIAGLNIKLLIDTVGALPVSIGAGVMALFAAWVKWGYKPKPKPEVAA
jgi:hypothetical protein